jgi:hypothetical protein
VAAILHPIDGTEPTEWFGGRKGNYMNTRDEHCIHEACGEGQVFPDSGANAVPAAGHGAANDTRGLRRRKCEACKLNAGRLEIAIIPVAYLITVDEWPLRASEPSRFVGSYGEDADDEDPVSHEYLCYGCARRKYGSHELVELGLEDREDTELASPEIPTHEGSDDAD